MHLRKEWVDVPTSSNEIKHVAMYLRISQEKKTENFETLMNHRALLSDYASEKGYTIEAFEEVLSGGVSELDQRPQLQRLLSEIERFDAILVLELSRLSRNGLISETVLQYCQDYNKPIITPEKLYDLANNDHDVLTFRFGSLIASQEHALIGKRSKSNKIQMAKEGYHISGNVPFGYLRNPSTKKLEVDNEAAQTIRYIFELHLKGLGSYKIRDRLNAEGYKSAKGKHFNLSSIKRIIRNPVYKGWIVFNDRKKVKKNGKFIYEIVDSIICKNAHPAIIDTMAWDRANKNSEERKVKQVVSREKPAIKAGVSLLKDLIYCSQCGRKMTIRKDYKSKIYTLKKCEYLNENGEKCKNAGIKLEHVERNVMLHLQTYKTVLKDALETLGAKKSQLIIEDDEQLNRLAKLEKHLKELEIQNKRLLDLALTGIFTNEELKEKKQKLTDSIKYIKMRHDRVISEVHVVNEVDFDVEIERILSRMNPPEINKNTEILNETLKTIIKKIYYSRVIPEGLLTRSTQTAERKYYPFQLEIEYH